MCAECNKVFKTPGLLKVRIEDSTYGRINKCEMQLEVADSVSSTHFVALR